MPIFYEDFISIYFMLQSRGGLSKQIICSVVHFIFLTNPPPGCFIRIIHSLSLSVATVICGYLTVKHINKWKIFFRRDSDTPEHREWELKRSHVPCMYLLAIGDITFFSSRKTRRVRWKKEPNQHFPEKWSHFFIISSRIHSILL